MLEPARSLARSSWPCVPEGFNCLTQSGVCGMVDDVNRGDEQRVEKV